MSPLIRQQDHPLSRQLLRWAPPGLLALWGIGLTLYYGRIGFMPLDQSIVFDGGYRILSGQVPYRDFYLPAGLVPSLLQALVFSLLGMSWFSYVLHAALANGLYAVVAFLLLRTLGAARWLAWPYGALSAIVFYPPIGVPYLEHHAFLFCLGALLAASACDRAGRRGAFLAAASATVLLGLAFLAKQSPTLLFVPVIVAVALWQARRNWRAAAAGLVSGAAGLALVAALVGIALALPFGAVHSYLWTLPASLARGRVLGLLRGRGNPGEMLIAALRLWPVVTLALTVIGGTACLALAAGRLLLRHRTPEAHRPASDPGGLLLRASLGLVLVVITVCFMLTTKRSPASAAPLLFIALGLVHTGVARELARSGTSPKRRRWFTALTVALFTVLTVEGWRFNRNVNATRSAVVLGSAGGPAHAGAVEPGAALPRELAFLKLRLPGFCPYSGEDLARVITFLRGSTGTFFLLGDTSVLYGLTGKPSVSPVLWYHPYLTLPYENRQAATPEIQGLIIDRLTKYHVRYVVQEGAATQIGVSFQALPLVAAWVERRSCGEVRLGGFRIIEVCDSDGASVGRAPE